MSRLSRVLAACLVAALTAAGLAALPVHAEDEPVSLRILAINDFHGNLKPPPAGIRVADPADPAKTSMVPAGGAEHAVAMSSASSFAFSFRSAPGRGSSLSAASRPSSTNRRFVR